MNDNNNSHQSTKASEQLFSEAPALEHPLPDPNGFGLITLRRLVLSCLRKPPAQIAYLSRMLHPYTYRSGTGRKDSSEEKKPNGKNGNNGNPPEPIHQCDEAGTNGVSGTAI
jgi:hypothetical protein